MSNGLKACSAPALRDLLLQIGLTSDELGVDMSEGDQAYADALYLLTRMHFSPDEAVNFWNEILRHHQGLNMALGRDVGIRVAVCDYFMNLHPKMRDPVIVEVQVLLQKEQGALLDELTGLYNRRYFKDAIAREVERFKRFGQRFSLVMLDVDHFKCVNDTYGHMTGDEALRSVAAVLRDTARTFDHVVRYGGEEFALILPQADAEQAFAAAERMRLAVEASPVKVVGHEVPLTVSLGVATFPEDALNVSDLLARADEALYQAKETRNSSCSYAEPNRRFPRTPIELMAFYTRQEGGITVETVEVTALNVSFGGLLCLSPASIEPATRVELTLVTEAPGTRSLRVNARVVRVGPESPTGFCEIAMSFELGSMEERRDLVRLVEMNQAPQS